MQRIPLSALAALADTPPMFDNSPTILFAGGGTGGHLFPGIAVAEELIARIPAARILFAGSERDVEAAIVTSAGLRHVALPSPPSTLLRRHPLRFAWQYWRACRDARRIVAETRPAAVVGLGGFASVPLVMAAKKSRVPIVLLEQNAVAGRATRRLARFATAVCHTFAAAIPAGKQGENAVVTGNPVRRSIAELNASPGGDSQSTLLVLGGSQGSTAVNDAAPSAAEMLRELMRDWRVVHQCGPNDGDRLVAMYRRIGLAHVVQPFFDDLPRRYMSADIVVSRAGATTLAELACAGVPAVLIPYPNAIHDHQVRNAEAFAAAGAARVVWQQRTSDETARQLADALRPLLSDVQERHRQSAAMRSLAVRDAASRVADCVLEAASLRISPRAAGPPHFASAERSRINAPS